VYLIHIGAAITVYVLYVADRLLRNFFAKKKEHSKKCVIKDRVKKLYYETLMDGICKLQGRKDMR